MLNLTYTLSDPPTEHDNKVLDVLASIITNGIESGYIDYWAKVRDYRWAIVNELVYPDGGRTFDATVTVLEHHEETDPALMGEPFELTAERMLTGVLRLVNGTVQGDSGYYDTPLAERLLDMLKNPADNDDFDAADADIIIQATVLGDVVYG